MNDSLSTTDAVLTDTAQADTVQADTRSHSAAAPPEQVSPMPGLGSVERIEQTLAAAESALDEARRHGDLDQPTPSQREPSMRLKVSVLMPVYNERATLEEIVHRVLQAGQHDELLIVDDCSTDGTRDLLIELEKQHEEVTAFLHGYNRGKGAALRTALEHARGDIVLVQDADLEYDPQDYAALIEPIQRGEADVVYGSRFRGANRVPSSWVHRLGNRLLTKASNLTTGLRLTDMETCYKAMRRDALRSITLREDRFGFEPEITAKLARRGARFLECPVRYNARGWDEGKKIGLADGLQALWCILRYAWFA